MAHRLRLKPRPEPPPWFDLVMVIIMVSIYYLLCEWLSEIMMMQPSLGRSMLFFIAGVSTLLFAGYGLAGLKVYVKSKLKIKKLSFLGELITTVAYLFAIAKIMAYALT